ncbi:helix-turn-helix domain-containing protein [Curtobacterium flaccumfaciens]|nr:helix-turn-helix domain-containing protein [Curtobacterium flaccumfaciens]
MGDALRALVDAAQLRVGYDHEVHSDDERTLDLGQSTDGVWIASSSRTDVWVRHDTDVALVRRGTAALFAPHDALTIGTDLDRAPPPRPGGDCFSATGVHVGTASFGPLAGEVFPLPSVAGTEPLDAPHADVIRTLGHLESLCGARWRAAHRDALTSTIVLTVLRDNPPSFLADNSIARCIDRLVDADAPVSIDDLRRGTNVSASTIRRRFRATTGCSPDQVRRWFRSLPVRTALAEGTAPAAVASRFGFSTAGSMWRALERVRAPDASVPPTF